MLGNAPGVRIRIGITAERAAGVIEDGSERFAAHVSRDIFEAALHHP
jgi:hypothetical protein